MLFIVLIMCKKDVKREIEKIMEKAIVVGVDFGEENFQVDMDELKKLVEACDMEVAGLITQRLDRINQGLYVGTGKVEEIKEFIEHIEADIVVFDNGLTPSQLKNLQKELEVPILDRTILILDIFSKRAKTREAKIQVETAKLQYLLPRLVGMHKALTRQGGTSGSMSNRGSGEKKLELDRRHIEHRIAELRKELQHIEQERKTQRKKRQESRIPKVALVGYTNAGKSTIMNQMVRHYMQEEDKTVLEKDMLFATLETTVRKIETKNNQDILLSDTVGFIHKLPHGLVKAFRSTLEEAKEADLLVQVIDYSDENYKEQMKVTEETLKELEIIDVPMIYVFNKADMVEDTIEVPKIIGDNKILMNAKSLESIEWLVELILKNAYSHRLCCEFLFPYDAGNIISYFMEQAKVEEVNYQEEGVFLQVDCEVADAKKYEQYRILE